VTIFFGLVAAGVTGIKDFRLRVVYLIVRPLPGNRPTSCDVSAEVIRFLADVN
jgi:hypothetical protein